MRCRPAGEGWRVSLFLVNATRTGRPGAEHHVYQPQIRIRTGKGTQLIPIDDDPPVGDDEGASLALLYAGKRALARGHLCAALWRDVDPERPFGNPQSDGAPFTWIDGSLLPPGQSNAFSPADARTELVPCYSVTAPQLNATSEHGAAVFDPEQLCELWSSNDVRAALEPLADGYERWIGRQVVGASGLSVPHQGTATVHVQQCRDALRRLREGIDLLCSNTDVRLAFCFANKAMALQSRWTRQRVDPWRPFQLVFQLINIPALAQPVSADRLACDSSLDSYRWRQNRGLSRPRRVTFGLRRLDARLQIATQGGGGVSVLSRYTLRLLTIQQFRRAVALVTACEALRVHRPELRGDGGPSRRIKSQVGFGGERGLQSACGLAETSRPTACSHSPFPVPRVPFRRYGSSNRFSKGTDSGEGDGREPAQVVKCPSCSSILAVPPDGFPAGRDDDFTWSCRVRISRGFRIQTLFGPMQQRPVARRRSHSSARSPRRLRPTVINRTTTP